VTYALELEHLAVDADGRLWKKRAGLRPIALGPVERRPGVRPQYAAELAELVDWWRDAQAGDERAEWRATYRRQSGV
jgi:hypothetical protein